MENINSTANSRDTLAEEPASCLIKHSNIQIFVYRILISAMIFYFERRFRKKK